MAYDDDSLGISNLFVNVSTLPSDGFGFVQLLFLTGVYAFFLFLGSNLISDGSELLLLIPSMAGVIGTVVLPILGAVPEAAIVFFSGQNQSSLDVGIGALAGSTIMLLTLPWFLVIIAGRVNVEPSTDSCNYLPPKLDPPDNFSLFGTAVVVTNSVRKTTFWVILSSLSYLLIEIPGIIYRHDDDDLIMKKQHVFSISTFAMTMTILFGYLSYCYFTAQTPQAELDDYLVEAIQTRHISMKAVVAGIFNEDKESKTDLEVNENSALVTKNVTPEYRLKFILSNFFIVSSDNKGMSGRLSIDGITEVFSSMGQTITPKEVRDVILRDNSFGMAPENDAESFMVLDTFVSFCSFYVRKDEEYLAKIKEYKIVETEHWEDVEEEVPEDLQEYSHEDQQFWILFRAIWQMSLGSAIILLFSDPIVDCFSEIGDRINVSAFYVAFVLAPLASNASELVASYNYALKKTARSVSISLSTLLGSSVMNNTVVLGVFMLVVFCYDLYFEFFAETIAILLVEWLVSLYVMKKYHTTFDAFVILSLYPLSIVTVYFLYYIDWG